jgi:hypothetical protein
VLEGERLMSAPSDHSFEPISTVGDLAPERGRSPITRRLLHTTTTAVLTIIIGLAVLDGLGVADVYGVDTATAEASGGGYDLAVRYGTVTRPALATPFEIVVTRDGGFDGPITIAVDRDYLTMWDENGLVPAPSAETSDDQWVEWEFDPPTGETLAVFYDARIEPAAQSGRAGRVAILEDDRTVVEVRFETRVLP